MLRVHPPTDGRPAAEVRINAVLFWFELHLGGTAVLSSAPRAALPGNPNLNPNPNPNPNPYPNPNPQPTVTRILTLNPTQIPTLEP